MSRKKRDLLKDDNQNIISFSKANPKLQVTKLIEK